jgi:hypothetical protein
VQQFVAFDGVYKGKVAAVDFGVLLGLRQAVELLLFVEVLDLGAVVEGAGVGVEVVRRTMGRGLPWSRVL